MDRISWKEIIVGTLAGFSIAVSPAASKMNSLAASSQVQMHAGDWNSLNSGPGLLNSGPINSDRDGEDHRGKYGRGYTVVAQANDLRQEDRREDRRADRKEDRRADLRDDRQADHQMDRREDRQLDRREDRRGDRQMDEREDRRKDHRSNAGGELRGLDRADRVAGEHGREGRDHARFMQNDGRDRGERIERYQRPERFERPEQADHPERSGRQ